MDDKDVSDKVICPLCNQGVFAVDGVYPYHNRNPFLRWLCDASKRTVDEVATTLATALATASGEVKT